MLFKIVIIKILYNFLCCSKVLLLKYCAMFYLVLDAAVNKYSQNDFCSSLYLSSGKAHFSTHHWHPDFIFHIYRNVDTNVQLPT